MATFGKIVRASLMFSIIFYGPPMVSAKPVEKLKSSVFKKNPVQTEDSRAADPAQVNSTDDLGFSQDEIKSDPQFQKELEARTDMLRIHQTLGLITAVPMTTEFILGVVTANNVANGGSDTGLHATLGITTAGLYITTAMFAILAPKPKGTKASGNTELHSILAWIHAPLMILTPLVGDMANDRIANHQPVGDLGTIHGIMAATLLTSYLTSLAVITF